MSFPSGTTDIAVQLYTVHEYLKTEKDLAQSLEKIGKIGYPAVQLSAVGAMNGENPEVTPELAKRMLDDNGLNVIATHRVWDELANNTQREIEFHKIVDCDYVAIGSLPPAYQDRGAEGYSQWVRDAQPVIARLKEAGIRFGYHNHSVEFARIQPGPGGSSRTLFDIILEEGGPDMLIEMDVYWVDHAGVNAKEAIERCHGKLPVVHIKDKEVVEWDPVMAPIGEGNLDWDNLLPALVGAGTQWIAVEQDTCRRDPFDCLKSSFDYLRSHPALAANS